MKKKSPAGKAKPKASPKRSAADARRAYQDASQRRADTSDIPEFKSADAERKRIVRRQPKVSLSLRLDRDLLQAFKAQGDGYQTRINDALRAYLALCADDDPASISETIERIEALLGQVKQKAAPA